MTTPPNSAERKTFAYKTIDGKSLEVDVIGGQSGERRPCVMWIHGGGLIFGSRTISPRPSFARALIERGFVVVSVDHRLAPETKLPQIMEDIADVWQWIHESGSDLFGADPLRVCTAGASAGAYLALMTGYMVSPRPRAIASFWGFGDITAPWEAEPSSHYCAAPLVTRSDAIASLSLTPVPNADGADRSLFYLYCRQQGLWLPEVTGHSLPHDLEWFSKYCPSRNISTGFPPTVLVHGRDDTDVPVTESDTLADRLRVKGVHHEFHSLPGVGHGFAGASPELIEATEHAVADFLHAKVDSDKA
jgi:acetyl esterase/lipase